MLAVVNVLDAVELFFLDMPSPWGAVATASFPPIALVAALGALVAYRRKRAFVAVFLAALAIAAVTLAVVWAVAVSRHL
jgi:hypothetical protein